MLRLLARIGLLGRVALLVGVGVLLLSAPTVAYTPAEAGQLGRVVLMLKIDGKTVESDLGEDGAIPLLALRNSIISPRDSASGLPTGRRQYQPITIRKRIDKASPLLMKALTENQSIEAQLHFYRPASDGTMEMYYCIFLEGGSIVDHQLALGYSLGDTATHEVSQPFEEISFTYQKITWLYPKSNISFEDDRSRRR